MSRSRIKVTLMVPGYPRDTAFNDVRWSHGQEQQPWQSEFLRLLGQSSWSGRYLPAAELRYAGSPAAGTPSASTLTASTPDAPIACADPIHLRADRDTARLMPAEMLQLDESEADALLVSINAYLDTDGLWMSRTEPCQWIIHGRDASKLLSYPPSFLAHRNVSSFLPDGDETGEWRRLMTELQMLLHTHPVNMERERQGRPTVNSVWFWGGASLQSAIAVPADSIQSTCVHASAGFATGLARHLGIDCQPLDAFDSAVLPAHTLIVDTGIIDALSAGNETCVQQAKLRVDTTYLKPLLDRIEAGDLMELAIIDEEGSLGQLDETVLQARAGKTENDRRTGAFKAGPLASQLAGLWRRLVGRHG